MSSDTKEETEQQELFSDKALQEIEAQSYSQDKQEPDYTEQ